MRFFATLFLTSILLISTGCQDRNGNYCGNSNRYTIAEIKGFDVYKNTNSLKLVSFKTSDIEGNHRLPMKNGHVNVAECFEVTKLNNTGQEDVFRTLINYDFSQRKIDSVKSTVAFCYNPRNAILFYDENDSIIGYVELCFECFGQRKEPSSLRVGEFCDEKFNALKKIFHKNGIEYGLSESNHDDQLEYLNRELIKYPDNPVLLTSSAELKMKEGEFTSAIMMLDKAIILDSVNWRAYFFRGQSRLKLDDLNGAVKDFDRALRLNDRITRAYHERALATISILQTTKNNDLIKKICNDLSMAQQLGDSSLSNLNAKYCESAPD